MQIVPPTDEQIAKLFADHVHRYPELAWIPVVGDRGKRIRLPIIVGNPIGVLSVPGKKIAGGAWATLIAAGMRIAGEAPDIAEQLARDCVLFPEMSTWSEWTARWPGISKSLADEVLANKIASSSKLDEPDDDEPVPAPLLSAYDANPEAVWRRARARSEVFALVVKPPSSVQWRLFQAAKKKPNTDAWSLLRGLIGVHVIGCAKATGDEKVPFVEHSVAAMIDQWPGIAISIVGEIGALIGQAAEIEMGNS